MSFTIDAYGPEGKLGVINVEALPLHERLAAPKGLVVEISAEDLEQLQAAAKRLLRVSNANKAMGEVSLNFTAGVGFRSKVANEAGVKLLALEARPFFLEKDRLHFPKLAALRSLGMVPEMRPVLKRHRERWETSAFGGVMQVARIGGEALDMRRVVQTWFNCDLFHSEPIDPNELSLERLIQDMHGEQQATALLALHLIASLNVVSEFVQDICAVSPSFLERVQELIREKSRSAPT